jgi:hypothetical protein
MTESPIGWTLAPVVLLLLFGGMLLANEAGRRFRIKHQRAGGEPTGGGTFEGAVFGLMGLMVAFTFSGAASRFDQRRHLIVEEAAEIGTAYLRIELLPAASQGPMKEAFRHYVDTRLQTYRVAADAPRVTQLLQQTDEQQRQIWSMALQGIANAPVPAVPAQILPSLNAMFDTVTVRTAGTRIHPPMMVWVMLGSLTLACSLLAGYGMGGGARRHWLHVLTFTGILSLALFMIIDMEYPRVGFIRVDAMDQVIQDVRDSMR